MTKEIRNRNARIIVTSLGVVGLLLLTITRSEWLMNASIASLRQYGDLYNFCRIRDFRKGVLGVPQPSITTNDSANPQQTHLLSLGDSFSEITNGYVRFNDSLSLILGEPVHLITANRDKGHPGRPFEFLAKSGVTKTDVKHVLILECVERSIWDFYGDSSAIRQNFESAQSQAPIYKQPMTSEWQTRWKLRWFTDADRNLQYLLFNNPVSVKLTETGLTMLYRLFGYRSKARVAYASDQKMLFLRQTVDDHTGSSFAPVRATALDSVVASLQLLRDLLKSHYNTELLFVPIPNNFRFAHLIDEQKSNPEWQKVDSVGLSLQHNRFLLHLADRLDKVGVRNVRVFERMLKEPRNCYFDTDTHWNAIGCGVGAAATAEVLKSMSSSNRQ